MKTYQYQSPMHNCSVKATYENGWLKSYEIETPGMLLERETKMIDGKLQRLEKPYVEVINSEELLLKMFAKFKVKYLELNRIVTFEMFWDRVKNKQDKEQAKIMWSRLNQELQIKAYDYYPTYLSYCVANNIKLKYPATYLNKKTFIV